jgi:Flp pilus assembly pilin Flp
MSHTGFWTRRLLLLLAAIRRQSGQTLAEYALMLAMIVMASVMAVTAITLTTNSYFTEFLGGFL